jgi:hypothetical protein
MIFPRSLSNLKEFIFSAFLALDGVSAPSPISPNGKYLPVRGLLEDYPSIFVSIGFESIISSCFFLFSCSLLFISS